MNMGILGMITLANPENETPKSTRGKIEITHSLRQLFNIAKLKWVNKNINAAIKIYFALGVFPLNDI